jgi:hypothetical protein
VLWNAIFSVEISLTRGIIIVLAGFEVGSVAVNTGACFQIYIISNARHLLHPSLLYFDTLIFYIVGFSLV